MKLNKELEIRFELTKAEYDDILNKLSKLGWDRKESFQEDTYFCDLGFVKQNQTKKCPYVIRIRRGDKNYLTYKSFLPDKTWTELESEIENPEAVSDMLSRINQALYMTIKKHRFSGNLDKFEINLDVIEDLGYFIEIEYMTLENANDGEIFSDIASKLGLTYKTVIKRGYVQLVEDSIEKKRQV